MVNAHPTLSPSGRALDAPVALDSAERDELARGALGDYVSARVLTMLTLARIIPSTNVVRLVSVNHGAFDAGFPLPVEARTNRWSRGSCGDVFVIWECDCPPDDGQRPN